MMFWSYIFKFKKISGHIQNQRALIRLQDTILYQRAKSANDAFHSLIKNDRFNEFDKYIHQDKEGWAFIHPFGGQTYFYNNEDMETIKLVIKQSFMEESILILNTLGLLHIKLDIFDLQSDHYQLPNIEKIKSKWYWLKQIFLSEDFLVFLIFFGSIITAIISATYQD